MNEKKIKWANILAFALGVAFMPPIWAVLSPYIGVTTGAVALICAGLFAASGNRKSDALKVILGLLCGDIWAVLAVFVMEKMQFNPNVELYCTLFVLGGLAVILGSVGEKFIYLPGWLGGWAIGLTIMGPMAVADIFASKVWMPVQIGIAMIVGVLYVGIGVDAFQKAIVKLVTKSK